MKIMNLRGGEGAVGDACEPARLISRTKILSQRDGEVYSKTSCALLLDKEMSTFYSNLTPTGQKRICMRKPVLNAIKITTASKGQPRQFSLPGLDNNIEKELQQKTNDHTFLPALAMGSVYMPILAPMSSSPEPGYLFSRALTSATGQIIKKFFQE